MLILIFLSESVEELVMLRRKLRESPQTCPRWIMLLLVCMMMTVKVKSKLLENDLLLVEPRNEEICC